MIIGSQCKIIDKSLIKITFKSKENKFENERYWLKVNMLFTLQPQKVLKNCYSYFFCPLSQT